jgi:hypothetical protein
MTNVLLLSMNTSRSPGNASAADHVRHEDQASLAEDEVERDAVEQQAAEVAPSRTRRTCAPLAALRHPPRVVRGRGRPRILGRTRRAPRGASTGSSRASASFSIKLALAAASFPRDATCASVSCLCRRRNMRSMVVSACAHARNRLPTSRAPREALAASRRRARACPAPSRHRTRRTRRRPGGGACAAGACRCRRCRARTTPRPSGVCCGRTCG